jgi:CBS-domain-containing membrane protein
MDKDKNWFKEFCDVVTLKLKLNSMVRVRERTILTERPPLVGEVLPTFADRGCHVVSVMDPYGRILGFLDRSRYFSIK